MWFSIFLTSVFPLTRDQALFLSLLTNQIPRKRECMRSGKIGPDAVRLMHVVVSSNQSLSVSLQSLASVVSDWFFSFSCFDWLEF